AAEPQSAIVLDGVNADDPGTGSIQLDLPLDAVAGVEVYPHPYTAEYGQFTGGVTVVDTRRGGDAWHAELNDFLPDVRIKGGHIRGVSDDSPRFNVNGPIVGNQLYLFQSASYTIAKSPVPGLSFPFNETTTEAYSSFTQLDRVLSPTHTESLTVGFFPE